MKKITIILIACFSLLNISSVWAEGKGNRYGVQFGSEMDFGGVYYGKDNLWAVGGKIGYNEIEAEIKGVSFDADSLTYSVFARKNFKIKKDTYLGLGGWVGWQDGKADTKFEGEEVETEISQWNIAPYFLIDYHLNEDFILNAGATIVNFKFTEATNNDAHFGDADTIEYMKPFLVLTYLF